MDRAEVAPRMSILAVGGTEKDRQVLEAIFQGSGWELHHAPGCDAAADLIRTLGIPVVICDTSIADGCWRDLATRFEQSNRPVMIISSRTADDRLWAEVLNVGGFDVLAKPFEDKEVRWAAEMAWNEWKSRHGIS